MIISFFSGAKDAAPKPLDLDWPAFLALVRKRARTTDCTPSTCVGAKCKDKNASLAMTLASYAEGAGRGNAGVLAVTAIALDVDHAPAGTLDETLAWLKAWGVGHLVYATHNHCRGGADDECFRVVVRASRDMTPAEWPRVRTSLLAASGIPADPTVKDVARLYYLPNWPTMAPRTWIDSSDGPGADVDALLAAAPPEVAGEVSPRVVPASAPPKGSPVDIPAAQADLLRRFEHTPDLSTYAACCILAREWALDDEDALPILHAWSELWSSGQEEATDDHFLTTLEHARAYGKVPIGREAYIHEALAAPAPSVVVDVPAGTDPASIQRGLDEAKLWMDGFVYDEKRTGKGHFAARKEAPDGRVETNIVHFLAGAPEFHASIRFNVYTKTIELAPHAPCASVVYAMLGGELRDWLLQTQGIVTTSRIVEDALMQVARRNERDPVLEYLRACRERWDGAPRAPLWLPSYLGAERTPFTDLVGARWLVSAVARAYRPGCQVDTVLTLLGDQGARKTTTFRVLGGEWYVETADDVSTKDGLMAATSGWITELAELSSVTRGAQDKVKALITRTRDPIRIPYGRAVELFPRRTVWVGTTNPDPAQGGAFLTDPTGARRYWPVPVGRVDVDALARDRDQLWGEAVALLEAGAAWWLDGTDSDVARSVTEGFTAREALSEPILRWWSLMKLEDRERLAVEGITGHDVFQGAMLKGNWDTSTARRVAQALRELQFVSRKTERARVWHPTAPAMAVPLRTLGGLLQDQEVVVKTDAKGNLTVKLKSGEETSPS